MSLQPPRDESLNGLLQGYRIYYRELESEAAPATQSKALKSPSALRSELTGEPRCPPPGTGWQEAPVTSMHLLVEAWRECRGAGGGARTSLQRPQVPSQMAAHRKLQALGAPPGEGPGLRGGALCGGLSGWEEFTEAVRM